MMHRRSQEVAERTRLRKEREDQAPRLLDEVPSLQSLRLEMTFQRGDTSIGESSHVRQVVIDRAPALFLVPCANRDCRDGGHDLTSEIMRGLRAGRVRFEGTQPCNGSLGSAGAPCTGVVVVTAIADYVR